MPSRRTAAVRLLRHAPRSGPLRRARHEGVRQRSEEPVVAAENEVTSLAVDRSGRLWVGTEAASPAWFPCRDTFVHFRDQKQDPKGLLARRISVLVATPRTRSVSGWPAAGVAPRHRHRHGQVLPLLNESGGRRWPSGATAFSCWAAAARAFSSTTQTQSDRAALPLVPNSRPAHLRRRHLAARGPARTHVDRHRVGRHGVGRQGRQVRLTYRHKNDDLRSLSDDRFWSSSPVRTTACDRHRAGRSQPVHEKGGSSATPASIRNRDRLSQAWVTAGAMTRDGALWVGTQRATSTTRFARPRLQYYRTAGTAITAIVEDRKNRPRWMALPGHGHVGLIVSTVRPAGTRSIIACLGHAPAQLQQRWIAALHADKNWHRLDRPHGSVSSSTGRTATPRCSTRLAATTVPGHVNFILDDPAGSAVDRHLGRRWSSFSPPGHPWSSNFTVEPNADNTVTPTTSTRWRATRPTRSCSGRHRGGRPQPLRHHPRHGHPLPALPQQHQHAVQPTTSPPSTRTRPGPCGSAPSRRAHLFDPKAKTWKRYNRPGQPSTIYGIIEDERGGLWRPPTAAAQGARPAH